MEEKLENPPIRTGLITMSGEVKLSKQEKEMNRKDPLDQCRTGEGSLLIGHPESWLTEAAEQITDALKHKGLIVGTFLDEFQMNLSNQWGSDFRSV